jgi:hypothetical protein
LVAYDSTADATIDMELFVDGGFTIQTQQTHYAQPMARAVIGPRALDDATFVFVPSFLQAYKGDLTWDPTDRKTFIDSCASRLRV